MWSFLALLPFQVRGGVSVIRWRGTEPGTCGRVGIRASDFIKLSGYDQDLMGVGYQDMDLWWRAKSSGLMNLFLKNATCTGWAMPNNPDPKIALSHSKMRFVSNPQNLTFGQMNARNQTAAWEKTQRKEYVRNGGAALQRLGTAYIVVLPKEPPSYRTSTN